MDNKLFFSCFSEDMKSYQLDLEFLHNIDTKNWKDEEDIGDDKEAFEEMSWNTMMEGFKRHEEKTGQNPMEMAQKQNEMIRNSIKEAIGAGDEDFQQKLEMLKKQNEEKERELEKQKKEMRERKQFYQANAPNHVKQQLKNVFNEVSATEPRIVEIDE